LAELSGGDTPVVLAYHGVETAGRRRMSAAPGRPPVVLSVGRLVEKKGHETLVQAAALLRDRGCAFRLRIVGEGVEWARLQRLVHELGLEESVTFTGPLSEAEVSAEYERAQVFALACRELENGDRDGIPNVVLEAMAHGLPIVSTTSPGIVEAVAHERSALLAEPGDAAGLADQLERVLLDPDLRERIGVGALVRVQERFDRSANLPSVLDALRSVGLVRGSENAGEEPQEVAALRAAV
jgi:glycosyltransferase involved in cell wall biosynthesis